MNPSLLGALAILTACSCIAADDSAFPLVGQVRPRAAAEIKSSTWSVGGETLDRDFAIYANYKQYLGPLGAKHLRVQAGWAKCERQRGVYAWQRLDDVVNDALAQGVQPWLEVSYGNTNYPGGGGTGLTGGLPKSAEALAAWDKWVDALVVRFKDGVHSWEVWNEPDNGKEVPADAYADFLIRTADVIHRAQPGAEVRALALAGSPAYGEKMLVRLRERQRLDVFDAITVHGYPRIPDDVGVSLRLRALLAQFGRNVPVIQGETGAPSTSNTFGALRDHPWTELTQAKWDLRRMLAHRAIEVPFNLFTLMELKYTSGWNTKGLLKANPDMTVAYEKPAYKAAQHVFAIFDDSLARVTNFKATASATNTLAACAYTNAAGAQVVTLWFKDGVPSDSNTRTPTDVRIAPVAFVEPVLVDLRDGSVRAIPSSAWTHSGAEGLFRSVPLYDSPVLIAEKSAVPLRPTPKGEPSR